MSLPRFLLGMLGVLVVFAAVTYGATQSVWSTFIQTLLCAVLIQIGYFAAVLFMVWRSRDNKQEETKRAAPANPADENPAAKVPPLPGTHRPRHF